MMMMMMSDFFLFQAIFELYKSEVDLIEDLQMVRTVSIKEIIT